MINVQGEGRLSRRPFPLFLIPIKLRQVSFVPWGSAPQPVQLSAPGELVGKGHDRAADFQQTMACLRVGDMAHLCVGNIQQPGQLRPVGGRLV